MRMLLFLPYGRSDQTFYSQTKKNSKTSKVIASEIVADRKGNAFIVEKIVKNCYAFYDYHYYLSILAVSIKIID